MIRAGFKRILTGIAYLAGFACLGLVGTLLHYTMPLGACQRPDNGPVSGGFSARALVSGGQTRCYLLYLPEAYHHGDPFPLVISLHGFGVNPEFQRYVSHWETIADEHQFALVYPQGSGFPLRFNAGPVYNLPETDDVLFIHDLIEDVSRLVTVDRRRIYANGMSGGAHMTFRLACELAEELAAVGMVAGAYLDFPAGCTPARPVPMIAFHGIDDPFATFHGRSERNPRILQIMRCMDMAPSAFLVMPGFEDWGVAWAGRNSCRPNSVLKTDSGEVIATRYFDCADQADVELYSIRGGGHTWPGGAPTFLGATTREIQATNTMWAFFEKHPLPNLP